MARQRDYALAWTYVALSALGLAIAALGAQVDGALGTALLVFGICLGIGAGVAARTYVCESGGTESRFIQ